MGRTGGGEKAASGTGWQGWIHVARSLRAWRRLLSLARLCEDIRHKMGVIGRECEWHKCSQFACRRQTNRKSVGRDV